MRPELRAIREERDRLRCELVDSRAKVADYRELQMELARARARVAHLDREMARLSAKLDRVIATSVAPLSDSSASQDGERGSSRYLRRSQPTGLGSFSTAPDTRSAASNSCKHTPGVFGRPSDTSPAPDVFRGAPPTSLTDVIRLGRPSPHHSTRRHGTPTYAAQFASPIHFFAEADTEQERRLKRMEETIRALQAEDIPTWANLSRKFIDQYQYCAETPPTLLELSMKEMAHGQRFEEYATKVSQPTQRVLPPQGQQGGAAQPRPRRQYPSLPVPLSHIYRQIRDKIGTIALDSNFDPTIQDQSKQCEYHRGAPGHTLDACWRLRERIQEMIDAKELVFNAVPWTYEGGVGSLEQQFGVMGITRSGQLYESPAAADKGKAPAIGVEAIPEAPLTPPKKVTEEEAEAFMNIIKASEYKVVEQMAKSPAHISLLALLLSSEPHREALLRVLTAAQVPKGTSPDRMEETINSIFSNTISFSDDELPSEGCAHSRALHIVYKCNNHIVGRVMIDNSSALNVCPVTTLKQMNIDLNRVRPSKTAVRAFDGSRREVNGEIDLLIDVGPCSFSVTFQKLKFIFEERIITVKGEEDYAIYKEMAVPYISVGNDENLPFHSFETISVIRDYGEVGPSRADRMIGKVLLRHTYIPGTGLRARGQGIGRPIEVEEYKHRRGLGFRPSCHEIIEARRGNHLHLLATHYGRLNRGTQVPPLSHFFPRPPLIIGGTLDGPSSDPDDTLDALPTVCAVTEEIPSGTSLQKWIFAERCAHPNFVSLGHTCGRLCNAAWECPPARGRATDAHEKESPLPVYDSKVEGR
ncbi:hypothetical protein CRG98_031985 [Punica granatum]|uniref:G-patch domain-containing protein n=1 Tax=Punica granatum TaxID=22663 RepID=A0A2I0IUG7_PUNGR|nr:hypothetical protein CRG98_031985 [Punica granatum]